MPTEKRKRAPGGGRKPKPPGEKFRRRNVTLPPLVDAAIEALQEGDEEYSATLARLLTEHSTVEATMRWIEAARRQSDKL